MSSSEIPHSTAATQRTAASHPCKPAAEREVISFSHFRSTLSWDLGTELSGIKVHAELSEQHLASWLPGPGNLAYDR